MKIQDYYRKHKGETCVIVSLGPNLDKTPPELFDHYTTFSLNSIYKRDGWKPDYYVGVDKRLWDENEKEIHEKFRDIPKFIPSPDYDHIEGENYVRFWHRTGGDIYIGGQLPNHPEALTNRRGITYRRIIGAVMQIAFYMGFSRILMIGVQHKPGDEREHFWGYDEGVIVEQPLVHWFDEYKQWAGCGLAEVLNISEDTYVPDSVIPRGNYKDWIKK